MKRSNKTQSRNRIRKPGWIRPDHHATLTARANENGTSIEFQLDQVLTSGFRVRRIPIVASVDADKHTPRKSNLQEMNPNA